jgi:ribosomal protein S27AE
MIVPHEEGWIDECWGRIIIAIGRGDGRRELIDILEELSSIRFDAGVQAEVERRTRDIAEKLMGKNRICATCGTVFTPNFLHGGQYYCDPCDNKNFPF